MQFYSSNENQLLNNSSVLEVRLARTTAEVIMAQRLRYNVFFDEYGAIGSNTVTNEKRDFDAIDEFCDHLIVLDDGNVVGSYRLISEKAANKLGKFYTASEYNIDFLNQYKGKVLELGRSCVAKTHRPREVLKMLWRGIAQYIIDNNIDLMFGCASFHGQEPEKIAHGLSYLYNNHLAPEEYRPKSITDCRIPMDIINKDQINKCLALQQIPSLIKGYVHLGAYIGDGAFLDYDFNAIDVCIVLFTKNLSKSYLQRFVISM